MKRARSESLTGGTGDVSPQLLSVTVIQTAANTFTQSSIGLPIPRFNQAKGKAIVFEVLKVFFNNPLKDNNYAAAGESSVTQAQIATRSQAAISFVDPATLAFCEKEYRGAFTAAGSYSSVLLEPYTYDCTDGAGHGLLVATDTIFIGVNTSNFAALAGFNVKILYRWKLVSVEEYIGIVQSQQ